jgi:hypothetical protein
MSPSETGPTASRPQLRGPQGLALPFTRWRLPFVQSKYALSFAKLPGAVVVDTEPYTQCSGDVPRVALQHSTCQLPRLKRSLKEKPGHVHASALCRPISSSFPSSTSSTLLQNSVLRSQRNSSRRLEICRNPSARACEPTFSSKNLAQPPTGPAFLWWIAALCRCGNDRCLGSPPSRDSAPGSKRSTSVSSPRRCATTSGCRASLREHRCYPPRQNQLRSAAPEKSGV